MKVTKLQILDMGLAVLLIITGVAACLFSNFISMYIHFFIGGAFLLMAGVLIIRYFTRKEYLDVNNMMFVLGMVAIVLGVLTISVPDRSLVAISVIWGAWSVIKAIHELNTLVQDKVKGEHIFFKTLFSLLELTLGVILLLELTEAIGHHVILLGVSFLIHGIRILINYIEGKPVSLKADVNSTLKQL